ncbi:MAG: hypothetical protein V1792_01930 [Pseudomonadota bacterium]
MKDKEYIVGNVLGNYPNLIHSDLHGRKFTHTSEFGGVNIFVREGKLPECDGRIDVAWITETVIHLAELKRSDITTDALEQFRRYRGPMQQRYPCHEIQGYLVGYSCKSLEALRDSIGDEPIRILRLGIEIPMPGEVVACPNCGAGLRWDKPVCPFCKR